MSRLLVLLALVSCIIGETAHAKGKPMIEVGADINAGVIQPWNETDYQTAAGPLVGFHGSFNLLFINADAEFLYSRMQDDDTFQFSASAGVLFLKVHEVFYRRDPVTGEQTRGMGGVGASFNLPGRIGEVTASVGAMAIQWQRPEQAEQNMYGVYAGGNLYLHIWKFRNELRVAYYAAPQINVDYNGVIQGEQVIKGWQTGLVGSDRLYYEAFKIPLISVGPELRAQVSQLPDGTEWLGTIGVGGTIGF